MRRFVFLSFDEKERAVLIADVGSRVNSRVLRRKIYLFESVPREEEANVDSVERFNSLAANSRIEREAYGKEINTE